LDLLLKVLENEEKNEIKKLVCFGISNCFACNANIIDRIMKHGIFEHPIWKTPSQDYQVNKIIF